MAPNSSSRRAARALRSLLVVLLATDRAAGEGHGSAGAKELCQAAGSGNLTAVRELVERRGLGPSIRAPGDRGQFPLLLASAHGRLEVVEYLVGQGAAVNMFASGMHRTPVWAASRFGHLDVVKFLCEHGADVTIPDKMLKTPAEIAAIKNHKAVAKYLASLTPSTLQLLLMTLSKWQSWLSVGGGFAAAVALVSVKRWWLQHASVQSRRQVAAVRISRGALRLAAKSASRSARCDAARVISRKALRTLEVLAGVLTLCGVFSYIFDPKITFVIMLLLFMAPATLVFGARDVLGTPMLSFAASTPASHAWACLVATALASALRHALLQLDQGIAPPIFVRNIATYNADHEFIFFEPFAWNSAAPICVLGHTLFVVNMGEAFRGVCFFELNCLWLYALVEGLEFARLGLRRLRSENGKLLDTDLKEKRHLAEQITLASRSSDPLAELAALGVQPEVPFSFSLKGLSSLDITLGSSFVDAAYFDVATIIGMLLSQQFTLAFLMTGIVSVSALQEWYDGILRTVIEERRETYRTGVLTDRLAKLLDTERGFEAFFSLMITSYSLPFITTVPLQLFQQVLSLLYSIWGLSQFLYERVDLEVGANSDDSDGDGDGHSDSRSDDDNDDDDDDKSSSWESGTLELEKLA